VASLQQEDGSFAGDAWGEIDTRCEPLPDRTTRPQLRRLSLMPRSKALTLSLTPGSMALTLQLTPGSMAHLAALSPKP
jgi:hypothetical protein